MNLDPLNILLQTVLLPLLAPLLSGCIRNWKAKLQNRRGARIWQPYSDAIKFRPLSALPSLQAPVEPVSSPGAKGPSRQLKVTKGK